VSKRTAAAAEAARGDDVSVGIPVSILKTIPISRRLLDLCDEIDRMIPVLDGEMARVRVGGDIAELARAYVALHRLKERFESIGGEGGTLIRIHSRYKQEYMPDACERSGQKSVPLAEGVRVGTSEKLRASIGKGRRDEAFAWLRKNGLRDLIVESVNAETLSKTARELREKNIDLPEPEFNHDYTRGTSVNKI